LRRIVYGPSSDERSAAFVDVLRSHRIVVPCRGSRGLEIDAACGQLPGNAAAV
jgi:adenine C2-methylase RlmN of 23S rRNA A2503 and tRNA A37